MDGAIEGWSPDRLARFALPTSRSTPGKREGIRAAALSPLPSGFPALRADGQESVRDPTLDGSAATAGSRLSPSSSRRRMPE